MLQMLEKTDQTVGEKGEFWGVGWGGGALNYLEVVCAHLFSLSQIKTVVRLAGSQR